MDPFVRSERIAAARATKVAGLVRALDHFADYTGKPVTSESIAEWTESQWERLALIGGVNPPGSQETRDAVIAAVRERETAWDRPLTSYCDRRAAGLSAFRCGGKWHVTVSGVTCSAVRLEEAVADCMNALFVEENPERAGGAR